MKAWTCVEDGASRRPSATVGVGKWLDSDPSANCCTVVPVLGSSPSSVSLAVSMDHTNPPATMGGPPAPLLECQRTVALFGVAVATATIPA